MFPADGITKGEIAAYYDAVAPRWEKQMVLNALALLLPEPLARHNGPSTLQVAVNEQAAEKCWVVHLLHYIPERRSQTIDIVEDARAGRGRD